MGRFSDALEKLADQIVREDAVNELHAERMGYDAGRNAPNTINCHFKLFATQALCKAWERGKKRGDAERESSGDGEHS